MSLAPSLAPHALDHAPATIAPRAHHGTANLRPFTRDTARAASAKGNATIRRRKAERDRLAAEALALASQDLSTLHAGHTAAHLVALHEILTRERSKPNASPKRIRELLLCIKELRMLQLLEQPRGKAQASRPVAPIIAPPTLAPPQPPQPVPPSPAPAPAPAPAAQDEGELPIPMGE